MIRTIQTKEELAPVNERGIPHLWCEVGESQFKLLAKGEINALRKSMAHHAKIMTGVFIKHPSGEIEEAKPCKTAFEDAMKAAIGPTTCATCKNWSGPNLMKCTLAHNNIEFGLWNHNFQSRRLDIRTRANFGCIHHEPKPLEQENSAFGAHLRNER